MSKRKQKVCWVSESSSGSEDWGGSERRQVLALCRRAMKRLLGTAIIDTVADQRV